MKKILLCICVLSVLCPLISCHKNEDDKIELNESEPLALAPDVNWALITSPYAAYKTDTDLDSETKGYCRKGDILQVLGKSIDGDNNVWYKFADGWLSSSSLTVYSNRYKALKVAEGFKK